VKENAAFSYIKSGQTHGVPDIEGLKHSGNYMEHMFQRSKHFKFFTHNIFIYFVRFAQ
jgi:hypothetical protein